MSKTNYLENKVLDHALGTTSYTAPSAVYVGLFTADPTDTGATTDEISGNGYSRQTITFDAASSGSATGPASGAGAVEFTASGGNWGSITHFGVFDASTAGNMLYKGALSTSKTVTDGDSIRFAEGSITITED
jgi:hypothetical protein